MKILLFFTALLSLTSNAGADGAVSYHCQYDKPGDTAVRITLKLPEKSPGPLTFIIPRAIPMGYANVRYDRFIEDLQAFSDKGDPLKVERQDGPRWKVGQAGEIVGRITYKVDIARMEREIHSAADASKLRAGYAGLLGYSVFGYVEGLEEKRVRLQIDAPERWLVFTTLSPQAPSAVKTTEAEAPNFYALADSQIMMGPDLRVRRFESAVPLYVVVYAETEIEIQMLGRIASDALNKVVAYFGSAPFAHYTVHQEYLRPVSASHEYGFSMEHLNSGTFFMGVDRALTARASPEIQRGIFLNFVHHIAHSWIPKRSYGEGYFPFNWELAPIIDTIWLSEGFIRYVSIEITGEQVADPEAYRKSVLDSFRRYTKESPAFIRKMSLIELSRTGSTLYSEDFRIGRNLFMRGALMAADIDERIRKQTGGKKRFRDLLRYLVAWSERERRAFRTEELPAIFKKATGVDVESVIRRWLRPVEE
ncbi:MAG: hypothetical protein L0229_07930 [Blastocatellia bacterium]|nr:hypothetical protein [Blastocatellia bacterium]